MKTIRTAYRLLSAITLIVFATGILVPAGASVAGLFCDMGHPSMMDHSCCDHRQGEDNHGEHDSSHATLPAANDCDMQALCMNAVDSVSNKTPVTSQQVVNKAPAAIVTGEVPFAAVPVPNPVTLSHRFGDGPESPPIFLLNASFLN